MTSVAFLTLIAAVVSTEAGRIELNVGTASGLRPGDRGSVYYELKVQRQPKVIDLGEGIVVDAGENSATLDAEAGVDVRVGYLVRFELPLDRARGSPDKAEAERQRLLEQVAELSEGRRALLARLMNLTNEHDELKSREAELGRDLAAARRALSEAVAEDEALSDRLRDDLAQALAGLARAREAKQATATERDELAGTLAEARRSLGELEGQRAELERRLREAQQTIAELASAVEESNRRRDRREISPTTAREVRDDAGQPPQPRAAIPNESSFLEDGSAIEELLREILRREDRRHALVVDIGTSEVAALVESLKGLGHGQIEWIVRQMVSADRRFDASDVDRVPELKGRLSEGVQ